MIHYQLFLPGGNLTALVDQFVDPQQRILVSNEILRKNPKIEQVGFLTIDTHDDNLLRLEMAGGEFCVNAARCAAYWHARHTMSSTVFLKVSGFSFKLVAQVAGGRVSLDLPAELCKSSKEIPEGHMLDLQGIRFILIEESIINVDSSDIISKYDSDDIEAVGLIATHALDAQTLTIDPWIWVRKTATLVHESACGSGSIAACLQKKYRNPLFSETAFRVGQRSGSIYEVSIRPDSSSTISGEVEYLGEVSLSAS